MYVMLSVSVHFYMCFVSFVFPCRMRERAREHMRVSFCVCVHGAHVSVAVCVCVHWSNLMI